MTVSKIETSAQYGQTNTESIRVFLELWPKFQAEYQEALDLFATEKDLIFRDPSFGLSWCHLYELPIKEHIAASLSGILTDEKFFSIFQNLFSLEDQLGGVPNALQNVNTYIDSWDSPTQEKKEQLMPAIATIFAMQVSIYNSLKCVLYFGCYLNELIERVRQGNDEALFNAIRIDSTVIACKPVIQRITKASLLQDKLFFKSLKNALSGKLGSLAQVNFQKMRIVLEILHEVKAEKLNDGQLHHLFVEVLNLYSWNEREGGNAKALRKFVDIYMKKQATT